MKKLILILALGAVLAMTSSAFADYNTDAISGPVTCHARGLSVRINTNRTQFTVKKNGSPQVFNVVGNDSDGDTEITYTGQLQFAHFKDQASLSFDDQGDTLTLNGQTISLRCPQ